MSDVIALEGVKKMFARQRNPASVYRALRRSISRTAEMTVAIDDLTLAIAAGEKIGVIGDNGSGKTTLLKLIAGLYQPTAGRLAVRGAMTLVAGLGIGMVDEATVEENLFLYGAIYGLERIEMRERIAEILEWAELSEFRAAKLKTLSTGMRSRLAFSAMRHVDTDIYLMDEVLSAGDIHFARKCESVFAAVKRGPKTFVVATHNVGFARQFCDRVLWMHRGRMRAFGDPDSVTGEYTR
jgi:lipopolysaccharide transport system ATP-binding protein